MRALQVLDAPSSVNVTYQPVRDQFFRIRGSSDASARSGRNRQADRQGIRYVRSAIQTDKSGAVPATVVDIRPV